MNDERYSDPITLLRKTLSTSILLPSLSLIRPLLDKVSAPRRMIPILMLLLSAPGALGQDPRPGEPQELDRPRQGASETPQMTLTDPVATPGAQQEPSSVPMRRVRRQGPPPPIRAIRAGGLRAEIAALIMSGQSGGALPLEVLVLPLQLGGDKARLPLTLEVPWKQLLAGHQDDPLTLEIFAYALTDSGGLRGSLIQTFEVDAQRLTDEQLAQGGLKFSGEMALEPGSYSLRVMARNPASGDLGLRILALQVPAEGTLLSPMLVHSQQADWQGIRQAYERGQAPPALPFLDRLPEAKPVLVSRGTTEFRILASRLAAVPSQLIVEAVDPAGSVLGELEAEIEGFDDVDGEGVRRLSARFETRLSPGHHRLRARLQGDMGERLLTPILPVVVVDSDAGGVFSWAKVDGNQRSVEPAVERSGGDRTATRTPARRRTRVDTAPMSAAYRAVLESLASGDDGKASDKLFELERGELRQGFDVLESLRSVEVDMARRVGKVDPQAMAPIMMLHHSQYQRMRQRKIPLLSTHARTVTLQLIEEFLQRAQSPQSQEQAVALMVSLGSEAQRAGMVRLSENLLRRVLGIDPTNEVALLNLGASAERTGDYPLAIDYFEQLVAAYPQHGQGQLRLAVNLKREGKRKAARRHLESIAAGQHREWVQSLAYQELVRFHLRANEFDEAIALLRRGIERMPHDEKLYLQLAFVLDANQQMDEVEKTLQAMELRALLNRDTPRHRYTEWPEEALMETRKFLDRSMRGQSAQLQTVLASSAFSQQGDSQ